MKQDAWPGEHWTQTPILEEQPALILPLSNKTCPHCGAYDTDDAKTCTNCGADYDD